VRDLCAAAYSRDGATLMGQVKAIFQGGSSRFFHAGTNGRWRGVFLDEDLALYEAKASPDFSQRVDGARSRALRTERGAPVGDLGSRSEDGARIRACDRDDEPALLCVEVQKAAARCR
jgi:hypothetical protein